MAANQGEVDIALGDEVVTLRSTLGAAKEVSAFFGNFVNANQRVANIELTAIALVVAAGLGKSITDLSTFEEKVFASGPLDIHADVTKYLNLLANGGRKYTPPKKVDGAPDSGN